VLFSALVATDFLSTSSASSRDKVSRDAQQPSPVFVSEAAGAASGAELKQALGGAGLKSLGSTPLFGALLLQAAPPPESIDTYEVVNGACTDTPKDTFNLGEEVCAKVANAPLRAAGPLRRVSFSGTNGTVASRADIITNPQTLMITLPSTVTSVVNGETVDNRGTWSASINATFNNSSRAVAYFSVTAPNDAAADMVIYSANTTAGTVEPGHSTGFSLWISNNGPDAAQDVHVTQSVPPNMTFSSATAGSGAAFACSESGGVVDCAPAQSMAKGAISTFTINYAVAPGAPNAIISSEVSVASTTTDPRPASNSATDTVEIRTAGTAPATCFVGCPANITATANTTQNNVLGAVVTFAGSIESSGDCGAVSTQPASGSFFPVGTTTVTVSSSTGGGSCSFVVTVLDTAPPTIACPANIGVTAADGACDAAVDVGTPETTGSGVTVTSTRSDGEAIDAPYPGGTTTITWTATDSDDRTVSCTQTVTVTVNDTINPTITAPPDVVMTTPAGTSGSCGMVIGETEMGTPTSDDNCSASVKVSRAGVPAGNFFPVGTTTVTYTATDSAGNTATATQHVTVTDGSPPLIAAPPDATYTCLSEVPAAAASQATSGTILDDNGNPLPPQPPSDNCGTPAVTVAETSSGAGSAASPKIITRVFTATDAAGNSASSTQTITVIDSTPPTISLNGASSLTVECHVAFTDPGATGSDNCSGAVTVARTGALDVETPGTYTLSYAATDAAGNTSAPVTRTVTVVDTTAPTLTAPANITAYLPLNSAATSVVVNYTTPVATDSCTTTITATQTAGLPSGASFPVGTTTNTFTATDASGNSTSVSFTVTVLYNFTGFFSPVSNLPTLNAVNAGRAIPVKFSLSGNKGLNIFAANSPASGQVTCASNAPAIDLTDTVTAGGSSLSYDGNQYVYVWKTESSWAGTCRQLVVSLNDGSIYRAGFKFK
jgi:hypothetical protein